MRHFAIVGTLALGLLGCGSRSEGGTSGPVSRGAQTLTGRLAMDAPSCKGGSLAVSLDPVNESGGVRTAEIFYESEPLFGELYRSTSSAEVYENGDSLEIVEVGTIEADELPEAWQWCGTSIFLSEPLGGGRTLSGTHESSDCECGGSIELDLPEVPSAAPDSVTKS